MQTTPQSFDDARRAYESFVSANPKQIKQYEQVLSMVSMMAPESVFGAYVEAFRESTFASLGLLTVYNDFIIHGRPKHGEEIFRNKRFTHGDAISACRLFNTAVTHGGALGEMLLPRGVRWKYVYLVEIARLASRLFLLYETHGLLVAGGAYESAVVVPPTAATEQRAEWRGRRSGRRLGGGGDVLHAGAPAAPSLSEEDLKVNEALRLVGESCFALRPLVYLVMKGRSKSSWSAATVAIALELISIRCANIARNSHASFHSMGEVLEIDNLKAAAKTFISFSPSQTTDAITTEEIQRRRWDMLRYWLFVRDPIYSYYVVPRLSALADSLGGEESWKSMGPRLLGDSLRYYNASHFHAFNT